MTEDDVINVGKSITALSSLVNVQTHKDARRNLSLSHLSHLCKQQRVVCVFSLLNEYQQHTAVSHISYPCALVYSKISLKEFEKIKER